MPQLDRAAPLPDAMQGRWVDVDSQTIELIVVDGEITCFGSVVDYDFKDIEDVDGALTVSLGIRDPADEDAFQRANITELVITPEGELHAYNVKFASQFTRWVDA
jgi:hypothetical protein